MLQTVALATGANMNPNQCKAARAMAGLSQQALADEAGVSRTAIARYELGMHELRDQNLTSIKRALELHRIIFTAQGISIALDTARLSR